MRWSDITWVADNIVQAMVFGIFLALVVIVLDVLLSSHVPARLLDDGGMNELIFHKRSVVHIAIIALLVSFCEELLFRGIIQPYLGIWLTGLLFTVIHFRYIKKWIILVNISLVSIGLGVLVELTGQLLPAIVGHFAIDFVLGILIRFKLIKKKKDFGR
ncbi:MAG: CPBP family intramembrane glutamic endopeptidase [Bacilli bacterium]